MAARETRSLRKAKGKLEKRVEETNLEEAKAQEIAKLQLTIEKLQAQAEEAPTPCW